MISYFDNDNFFEEFLSKLDEYFIENEASKFRFFHSEFVLLLTVSFSIFLFLELFTFLNNQKMVGKGFETTKQLS